MPNKIKIGILFGGKSAEHEVSLQSARNVVAALDRSRYEPVLIGIDKQGRWRMGDESNFLLNARDPKLIKLNQSNEEVALVPECSGQLANLSKRDAGGAVDVVFPILHGPFGEDGTVQGLLKLADVPFVGASVLGSAVGMDKDVMKRLMRDAGIPIPKFIACSRRSAPAFTDAVASLGLPFFVKPANLGSSVGISKVRDEASFSAALDDAFKYDTKAMIEEFIEGREIECAVLGNDDPIASVPGEVIPSHEFYSYEAKYIDEDGASFKIPADLPDATRKRVQELAIATFKAVSCEGMGRVDFFLRGSGEVIVNEINTIPGFTSISMYPRLWEASGIPYAELIDRLVGLAIERHERERKIEVSYT